MSNECNDRDNTDEVASVESALVQFSPRAANVDRDRLMFLAGAAEARVQGSGLRSHGSGVQPSRLRSPLAWPAATAALAATSLALAVALVVRPEPPVRIVYQDRPAAVATTEPPAAAPAAVEVVAPEVPPLVAVPTMTRSTNATQLASPRRDLPGSNYLQTREVALRMGLDALGTPRSSQGAGGSAPTYFDWLSELANAPSQMNPPEAMPGSKM